MTADPQAQDEIAALRLDILRRSVPAMYRGVTWDGLRAEQQPAKLASWLTNAAARHLFLTGPAGTGKTHAATAVAFWYLTENPGQAVQWWSVPSLLDALRPGQAGGDGETTWQRVRTADILVLDDLAHTRPTEWAVERMWILADHRLGAELRTVITTNATWEDLTGTWGAATMDRFRAGTVVVKLAGESLRRPLW